MEGSRLILGLFFVGLSILDLISSEITSTTIVFTGIGFGNIGWYLGNKFGESRRKGDSKTIKTNDAPINNSPTIPSTR